jgi:putative ABC transport system ATP-binding protein
VPADTLLSVHGLTRAFEEGARRRVVLDGLDLEVGRGERVALLGRSGSGKSTLLNLVSGIDLPDAGEVRIGGTNLTALGERERTLYRRRHIGFVYQFFNLLPTLTVEENVRLPLALTGTADLAPAHALLERVGLRDRAGAFPDRLSAGEQQRVALARALVHRPLLVLADEPTGSLDAETGRQMLALLDELTRERGATLILVTHSREVTRLTERVLLLEGGRIAPATGEVAW